MNNDNRFDANHDEPHQSASVSIHRKSSGGDSSYCDRSGIRVFEIGISNQPTGDYSYGSRTAEQEESQRLIDIAKKSGCYYPTQSWADFGDQHIKQSGESRIFVNEAMGLVFKVRDPFAKAPIKCLQPQEVIYEHLVHNLLFSSARYNFVGISEDHGDVRIILSQEYVSGWMRPSQTQIDTFLTSIGLKKEDGYYYGNEYLAVTDVASESDNVLLDESGNLRFIDPIIRFRKPAIQILDTYPSEVLPQLSEQPKKASFFQRLLNKYKR